MTETELAGAMADHGPAVYRLALCRLQSVPDAEDVYQDVFLALFRQDTAGWDREHTKAWCLRCAVNRCADVGRRRLRRPVVPLETVAELAGQPPDPQAEALWEAVGRLPEKLRLPVHLYYGEGYDTGEIAGLLNVPAATVRSRLHRARRKLNELLGGMENETSLS